MYPHNCGARGDPLLPHWMVVLDTDTIGLAARRVDRHNYGLVYRELQDKCANPVRTVVRAASVYTKSALVFPEYSAVDRGPGRRYLPEVAWGGATGLQGRLRIDRPVFRLVADRVLEARRYMLNRGGLSRSLRAWLH